MTGKASTDAKIRQNSTLSRISIYVNKPNASILRRNMSENKHMIYIVLHVMKSFAAEFWNHIELCSPEFLSKCPTY